MERENMKIIMSRCRLTLLCGALSTLTCASGARAHEFFIKPAQMRIESGAKLPFNILATHVFMVSEEVEPVNTVKAWLFEGDKSTPVGLKENHTLKTVDGTVTPSRKGTAILVGRLQEPIESTKAEGSNRSQRIKREKFAKALITVSADDDSDKKVLGHKLEIVPVSNVTITRAGDELSFKFLLDGKPLRAQVFATYDGFSRRSMTFAYVTESAADGLAVVKVTSPGVWMVRVEKRIEANAKEFDLLALKATLVFSVQ
jgi:uncharacterized GH25 family protein